MSESPPAPFAFEPVPSASKRHDGWTPERQRGFTVALSRIGMVAAAARTVGMSSKSAYELFERRAGRRGTSWQPSTSSTYLRSARRSGAFVALAPPTSRMERILHASAPSGNNLPFRTLFVAARRAPT